MTEDLETRLTTLTGLVREAELLRARRTELDQRHARQAAALTELRAHWAGEVRDVERLEGLSLSRVLVALRGVHAEELSREQAEADAARYRVAESESRLAAIEAERAAVDARLADFADLPVRFARAVDDKEAHLRRTGGPQVTRLLHLAGERGRVEAELRELHEAGRAADVALGALAELRRQLDRLSERQLTNNVLGGAVALRTPNWLDAVAWASAQADRCLVVLHTELADVGLARPLGAAPRPVVTPTGFAQVFFSDLLMRDQIDQAIRNTDGSAGLVGEVRRDVNQRTDAARAHWSTLMRERQDLLTG